MYFPFLRGKQNELLALKECTEKLSKSRKVVPIIEPVNTKSPAILKCINELCNNSLEHIIVYNSQSGDISKSQSATRKLFHEIKNNTRANHFAFIIHKYTNDNDLNDFINDTQINNISIIHKERCNNQLKLLEISSRKNFKHHIFIEGESIDGSYINQFNDFSRVVISNSFRSVNKNAEYAEPDHEVFTKAHLTYSENDLFGFGDYTVLGDKYRANGFQPYTAALHLTHEFGQNNEIWVKHFISKIYDYPTADQAKLIHEALPEMVRFIMQHNDYFKFSIAAKEIIDIYNEGRSTNLGYMKKLAIKHHIELLIKVL